MNSLLDRIDNNPKGGKRPSKGDSGAQKGRSDETRLAQMRQRRRAMPDGGGNDNKKLAGLKRDVQDRLRAEVEREDIDVNKKEEVKRHLHEIFDTILAEQSVVLTGTEKKRLFDSIAAEILGFGPLEELLSNDDITEIMVNGPKNIFVEQKGLITRSHVTFETEDHVLRVIDRIVAPLGRRVDESSPIVDARLPDGSRVNAIIRPLSLVGPTITIRKFSKIPLTTDDLIRFKSITPEIIEFLNACVHAALNIIVSGGTGSGKTTLLNVLSGFIPSSERIITVENAAELQLRQEHVVTLETRPANIEGKGEISIQDLVVNCLRMRPDRIVVGECRGGEALDMLQAMNTGHDGSLTTAHSNSPRDTIARLEVMCLMAGMELPQRAIREQIASAVDLICHQDRLRDGTRKVTAVTEIQGMEGDIITMSDIFEFELRGMNEGKIVGRIRATGLRPKFWDRIVDTGLNISPKIFMPSHH